MRKSLFVLLALALVTSVGCSRKSTPPPVRIAYNYCTLSYTMAYWGKTEWTAELDRLEKAGYNAALLTAGLGKVWQRTLKEMGYADLFVRSFVADEAYQAWWHMGNLEGEGGPVSEERLDADAELGAWLYAEMKKRGIEPMVQAFIGTVPSRLGIGIDQGMWCQVYRRPAVLDPSSREFAWFSELWYRNLRAVYKMDEAGTPKYLVGDLFHEGGRTGRYTPDELAELARGVQRMQIAEFGPEVTWVLQAWQLNDAQAALYKGLSSANTLIEFLDKDMGSTAPLSFDFKNAEGDSLPWVWAEVSNFGGNTGLRGALTRFASMNAIAPEARKAFRGYALLSEGLENNPAMYALFERNMMRSPGEAMTDEEVDAFFVDYFTKRYGFDDPRLVEARKILKRTAWTQKTPHPTEGCVENILCALPSFKLTTESVSTWGTKTGTEYDPTELKEARRLYADVLKTRPELRDNADFMFDFVELSLQTLADRAREIIAECEHSAAKRAEFLRLLDRSDEIAALTPLRRFDAHDKGPNYRRLITSWTGNYRTSLLSGLHDYAHRAYAGLLKDYYKKRWEWFFAVHEGKLSREEYERRLREL